MKMTLPLLTDVDEAAAARHPVAEPARIHVAAAVALGIAEAGDVQSTAVDEVELVRMVDGGGKVHRRAEVEPSERNTADHAWIDGERDQILDTLLGGDGADGVGQA
jgi:hypothetical protein